MLIMEYVGILDDLFKRTCPILFMELCGTITGRALIRSWKLIPGQHENLEKVVSELLIIVDRLRY